MASAIYNIAKSGLMDGTIDLDTHTFEIMLMKSSATPVADIDGDTVSAAFSAGSECDDASYTANGTTGRIELSSLSVTTDDSNDLGYWDAADVTYSALTGETVGAAMIYKVVGTAGPTGDASHIPVIFVELNDAAPGGADYIIQWSSSGIITLS